MQIEKPHVELNRLPANASAAAKVPEKGGVVATAGQPEYEPPAAMLKNPDFEVMVARESMQAGKQTPPKQERFEPDFAKVRQETTIANIQPADAEAIRERLLEQRAKHPKAAPEKASNGNGSVEPAIADAATKILLYLGGLSNDWRQKIEAMRIERQLDDTKMVCSLIAHTLDTGNHLIVPLDHEHFAAGHRPDGSAFTCLVCGEIGQRVYGGQPPLCNKPGTKCPAKFYALPKQEQAELLALAE